MGKDKSAKRNKTSRKIQDLPAKGKRAAAIKGGIVWGHPRVLPVRTDS